MSYDVTKVSKVGHLKAMALRAEAKYATKKSVTDLADRIDLLEVTGGQANVLEGVKVNGTALTIADKLVDILITAGKSNGTISVNNMEVSVKGLAALAYKANVSESDLEAALKTKINNKAEASDLTALQSSVETLTGAGDGSVKKIVDAAINDFATRISDNGEIDTFKELVDYVAKHGPEAATMTANIAANTEDITNVKKLIGSLPDGIKSTTVIDYVAEAIAAIGIGDYAKVDAMNKALEGKVDKADGQRLMTDAEAAKLLGIATGATKTEASTKNGYMKVNGSEVKVYELPSDVIKGAIATDAEVEERLAEVIPTV